MSSKILLIIKIEEKLGKYRILRTSLYGLIILHGANL